MDPILIIVLITLLQMIFLFPIRDRRRGQRGFPWMTGTIVSINVLIHVWVTITVYSRPDSPDAPSWLPLYPFMQVSQLIVEGEGLGALPVLTSTFLHAGLGHLLGNMFVLWFFGRKIEDATGSLRFGLFYLLCGFAAGFVSAIANIALSPANAQIPSLGASGAISGVMGAYLFLYSDQKVLTLVSARLAPLIPLPGCFIPVPIPIWLPAWVYLLYNFLRDALLAQFVVEMVELEGSFFLGIGVFAHLGGAAAGLVFIYFFLHPEVFAQRR